MLISVIIPSYNRADMLLKTVQSVDLQTLRPGELIIVDDASPDNTQDVVKKIQSECTDLNIVYIHHEKNKGEAGARNTGICAARGEYLAFLDSDDEWLPEKLERQMAFLKNSDADGVFCETLLVEEGRYEEAEHIRYKDRIISAEKLMTEGCGYGVGTNLMIRKSAIKDILFDENLRLFTDLDWLYNVAKEADIRTMPEALSYYHKAPMRQGDYVHQLSDQFLLKYKDHLSKWPLRKRYQVYSCMNWYIAHAYKGNDSYLKAAHHFMIGLFQNPLRHPGAYVETLRCCLRHFMPVKA